MPLYRRVPKRGFTNALPDGLHRAQRRAPRGFDRARRSTSRRFSRAACTRRTAPLFKVLGDGELTKALTVRAQKFSKSAADKIRSAGGTVVELDEARARDAARNRRSPEAARPQAEGEGKGEKQVSDTKGEKKPKAPKAPQKDDESKG
jgi:hypothetical protein